jgi:hypothetical protein
VFAGVTGSLGRSECVSLLHELLGDDDMLLVDVAPAFILQQGLPYARSSMAIILDASVADVPPRYRERDRARRLVGTLIDAVPGGGFVICPADETALQEEIRRARCLVAAFSTDGEIDARALEVATAVARIRDGSIWVEHCGDAECTGALRAGIPVPAQVAAALAAYVCRSDRSTADCTPQSAALAKARE